MAKKKNITYIETNAILKLDNIIKDYPLGNSGDVVHALKGVSINFRKNEFVSILGPSGCGKTTLLNIIGGLDHYTDGDLIIDQRSTKNYNDHDWDIYRNHHIGFIFQSYNLIPHQTIEQNVELALTISGVSKKERVLKARKALDKVGLAGMYAKKPNQLSGGQCQRVAIARALVNEPDILLADEPTGALDTVTSKQIMDLIQEVSKEKLVIMVTHNPELADIYSTRIIRLLDGNVVGDTNPYDDTVKEEDKIAGNAFKGNFDTSHEKAKMSFFTAFKLSSKNLYSKFRRTLMVSLAGCIGIVGVSTVLAVSNGVQNYINDMENDMLSGNPVYITSSTLDYSSIMGGSSSSSSTTVTNPDNNTDQVYISSNISTLVNMNGVTKTNDISKEYMDFLEEMPDDACELIQYDYSDSIAPNIFTDFETCSGTHKMSVSAIQATYVSVLENIENLSDYASMIETLTVMSEMPSNASYIANQYDVVYIENGYTLEDVLKDKTSLIAVASQSHNTLSDLELAEYGYFSQERFLNYCYKLATDERYDDNPALAMPEYLSYETLASKTFTWYPNDTVYSEGTADDDLGDKWYASGYADGTLSNVTSSSFSNYSSDFDSNYSVSALSSTDSVDLNVKCVLKLKEDLSYGCLSSGGLYYTNELSNYMRDKNYDSDICESARNNSDTLYNVELGYEFRLDGTWSKPTIEKYYLSSGSSSILSYISKFFGSSGSGAKSVSSYSLAALGGKEFPTTVYFYCNDFDQKDKLTAYLDIWNENNATALYKVDTNGFYVGKHTDEEGNEYETYYYYDKTTNGYYSVDISKDGYALDYLGNQYKPVTDDNGETKLYKVNMEKGDPFTIDGDIKISNGLSISAYSLLSYTVFGDEFTEGNVNYDYIKEVPNSGGYLYTFQNADGEAEYVMKVQNQSFYKLALDKDGNIISESEGYERYRYDEDENCFYKDSYVLDNNSYSYVYVEEHEDEDGNVIPGAYEYVKNEDSYVIKSEKVDEDDYSQFYADDEVYNYANAVKNPEYTMDNGTTYVIDTHGLYMSSSDMTSLVSKLDYEHRQTITDEDGNEKILIELTDYSGIDFYYKDLTDTEYKYYFVDYEEEYYTEGENIPEGKTVGDIKNRYIIGSDISEYIDSTQLADYGLESLFSDRYLLMDDGSLRAISVSQSTVAETMGNLVSNKVLGDKLTDLSVLEIDESLKINYTDTIGLIIAMVNTLINVITYALIAFTALSLVVSTVMIGIITYVSVVERIKEIGVIRALGGRKKDVSHLFNAETFIIGLASGILGILLTYLLSFIINMIVGHLSGIYTIASLPASNAVIMILISVGLTLISGLIPASSAAKKDPVIALRTE